MMPEELREVPQDNDDHEWWYTETAYWVLEHLDNKLNDHAPDQMGTISVLTMVTVATLDSGE
jgi:hypothetical protein